ncbi:helix-turn-helix transcriptional regulator [Lederbergia lenta]|uniref:helix-turn-helix transcriptional regulator n=1 Tax=Lederbergia lenta TaxID=1467 RepID=UPI003D817441
MGKDIFGKCLLLSILYKRKLTQLDLASLTGIHKNQINEYISNKRRMSLKNARIISVALRCKIEDLYEWKE